MIGAAAYARWRHANRPLRDAHGGVDTALLATSERLEGVPFGRQLDLLLEQVASPDLALRCAAFEHLCDRSEPAAIDRVCTGIHDNFSRIRQRCVERAVHMDPDRGWPLLAAALGDEDDWVREAAANQCALLIGRPEGKAAPRTVLPGLVAAIRDESPAVRSGACTALRKWAGKVGPEWRLGARSSPEECRRVADRWSSWFAARPESRMDRASAMPPSRIDPGPEFRVRTLDGGWVDARSLRGKPVLIHFWGTWCGPCQWEMPALAEVHRRRGSSVTFLGVAVAERGGPDAVRAWTGNRGIAFAQAMGDPGITEAFGDIGEVPVTFLLDGSGRLRRRWDGERLGKTIDDAIGAVMAA